MANKRTGYSCDICGRMRDDVGRRKNRFICKPCSNDYESLIDKGIK